MKYELTPEELKKERIIDTTTRHDEGKGTLLLDAAINLCLKLQEHDYIVNGIEVTSVLLCDDNRLTLLTDDKTADKEFLDEVESIYDRAGIRTYLEGFGIDDGDEGLHFTYCIDID